MKPEEVKCLQSLLGPAVLLPVQDKKPLLKGWQKMTLEECAGKHEAFLLKAESVGVALGPQSGHLITIDLDSDAAAEEFLILNPWMTGTLRSRGARGCNFWFRMVGGYPQRTVKITRKDGSAVGEWRSGGAQTVIAGRHPAGCAYERLNAAAPIRIPLAAIRWPVGWRINGKQCADVCGDIAGFPHQHETAQAPTLVLPHSFENAEEKAEKNSSAFSSERKKKRAADSGADQTPATKKSCGTGLNHLYQRFVVQHHTAQAHGRNAMLVKAVAFLVNAVAEPVVETLLLRFYDEHAALWHDSREQHLNEVRTHMRNVLTRWEENLPATTRQAYLALGKPAPKAAFRICRSLASGSGENASFFLSCDDLASRLDTSASVVHRMLQNFQQQGLVALLEKGLKRAPGQRGMASRWRWLMG